MKNGKLQIGIIGCGNIANNKHMPSLKKLPELCEMVAFCDIIEEKAAKAADEYGVTGAGVYTDYRKMLKEADIDVIHVLTPNFNHCPITVDALLSGKHVMCEKPMATNTADARKMIEAWKRSGKHLTFGYQNRFRPEVQMLKKSCEAGELGEIYYAQAHAVRRHSVPAWGVFLDKEKQGGGPLIDIGTHALDITLWMMNNYKPVSVSGSIFNKRGTMPEAVEGNLFGSWDPDSFEVEDFAFGMIKMADGSVISVEAGWTLNMLKPKEASTTLCGTKAGAEINYGMGYPASELIYNTVRHGMLTEERISPESIIDNAGYGVANPGYLEAKQWLNAILNNTMPLVNPVQAFAVTQIIEAIYESSRTGREVILG